MTRKRTSPRVTLDITDDIIRNAVRANSAACVIADTIKAQVPGAVRVSVDLATIAWTDPKAGVRYTYLTPDQARVALFAFDRGVTPPAQRLTLQRAVRVAPITRHPSRAEARAKRREVLEAKARAGAGLTPDESRALAKIRQTPPRPTMAGRAQLDDAGTVIGGGRPSQGGTRAARGVVRELLPANVRVFGARVANMSDLDVLLDAARDEGRAQALRERTP